MVGPGRCLSTNPLPRTFRTFIEAKSRSEWCAFSSQSDHVINAAQAASSKLAIDVREFIDVAHGRIHPYNYGLKVKELVSARSTYT